MIQIQTRKTTFIYQKEGIVTIAEKLIEWSRNFFEMAGVGFRYDFSRSIHIFADAGLHQTGGVMHRISHQQTFKRLYRFIIFRLLGMSTKKSDPDVSPLCIHSKLASWASILKVYHGLQLF